MRIDSDFADLEAVLAVKETGSIHLAWEKLNPSQSAATRRERRVRASRRTRRNLKSIEITELVAACRIDEAGKAGA